MRTLLIFTLLSGLACDNAKTGGAKMEEPGPERQPATVVTVFDAGPRAVEKFEDPALKTPPDAAVKAALPVEGAAPKSVRDTQVDEAVKDTRMIKILSAEGSEGFSTSGNLDDAIRDAMRPKGGKISGPEGAVGEVEVVSRAVINLTKLAAGSSLEQDDLQKRIRSRYLAGLKRCHVQLLKVEPKAAGRITGSLSVGPTGRVTTASFVGFDDTLSECLASQGRRWRFGAPKDSSGKPTSAEFELVVLFKPGS